MLLRPFFLRSHLLRANGSSATCPGAFRLRTLHTTSCLRADVAHKNHYERLNLRPDASHVDIKKSYFSLSKAHHPDTNRSDPNASHTFSLLSESYKVLSDPHARATYDRDVLRLHHHPLHGRPHGSYHSSSAGGRAPSGLSRRRGTFRGPPPSFYRSGGWGEQEDKRRKAHEESTGTGNTDTAGADPWASAHSHYNPYGGMGPGSDPFHHASTGAHFDRAAHTRTQSREDQRRSHRARQAMGTKGVQYEEETSVAGHFFIITGILAATLAVPLIYMQIQEFGKPKQDKKK